MVNLNTVLKKDLESYVEKRGWKFPKDSKRNKPDYVNLIESKLSEREIEQNFADKTRKARKRRSSKKKSTKRQRRTSRKSIAKTKKRSSRIKKSRTQRTSNRGSNSGFTVTREMYEELARNVYALSSRLEKVEKFMQNSLVHPDLHTLPESGPKSDVTKDRIITAIRNINLNNADMRKWVPFDVLYDDLGVTRRLVSKTERLILELFYDERVELEEGDRSRYRVSVRGSTFSRIKLK